MTIQFYFDPAATGANDGSSWTNAYTAFATAMTGMAAYNSGTMAEPYVLNCLGLIQQSSRFLTGTSFTGNSATNTITIDGGAWTPTAGIPGNQNTFLENTGTADEGMLIQEDFMRLTRVRLKTARTVASVGGSIRVATSGVTSFYARDCFFDNQGNIGGNTTAACTRTFDNCIFDLHVNSNTNFDITGGTSSFQHTINVYNCLVNFGRFVTGAYTNFNFINSIYICSTAIFRTGSGSTLVGDYSSFYADETATLDSETGAIMSTGNIRAANFTDETVGNFTYSAAGLTAYAGLGIGPSSDANVPTTSLNLVTRSGATSDIGPYQQAGGSGNRRRRVLIGAA